MENLIIVHRKGKYWWLLATATALAALYLKVYDGSSPERFWILHVLSVVFIGYTALIYFWTSSVEININDKVALAMTQIFLYRKTTRYRLGGYTSVAVAAFLGIERRVGHYKIGLRKANERVDWILDCFPIEFAWENSVKIAQYLNLPVYDMLVKEPRTWNQGEIPATLEGRVNPGGRPSHIHI